MKTLHVTITFADEDFDRPTFGPVDIWNALCRGFPLCRGSDIDVQPSNDARLCELDRELRMRGLSCAIHPTEGGAVVHLFAPDDPMVMHVTFHDLIERAVALALKEWDDEHDDFVDEEMGRESANQEVLHSVREGRRP